MIEQYAQDDITRNIGLLVDSIWDIVDRVRHSQGSDEDIARMNRECEELTMLVREYEIQEIDALTDVEVWFARKCCEACEFMTEQFALFKV